MSRPWLQLAITFLVSLSLVAAPCRNCQPKQQSHSTAPAHDCCPKPKPQKSEPCAWQPAAYDAVESKAVTAIEAPAVPVQLTATELPYSGPVQPLIPSFTPSSSPPSLTVLRI